MNAPSPPATPPAPPGAQFVAVDHELSETELREIAGGNLNKPFRMPVSGSEDVTAIAVDKNGVRVGNGGPWS